jgi:hypothetical protein
MIKYKFSLVAILIGVLLPLYANSEFTELRKGFDRKANIQLFREIKAKTGFRPSHLVSTEEPDYFFGMSRDGRGIASYSLGSSIQVQGWPVGLPPQCPNGVSLADDENYCDPTWWDGRWGEQEVIDQALFDWQADFGRYVQVVGPFYADPKVMPGCLGQSPLRYGDINDDGQPELVLILADTLVVFSLQQHKTIFAALISYDDWMNTADTARMRDSLGVPGEDYQYASESLANAVKISQFGAGYRGYAKLYMGDFDGDGRHDILVWRKLYRSRLASDPVSGFSKVSDTRVHYSIVDGEYQLQETPAETIEQWLAANDLGWQQGYPNTSECSGEEGQHIPAMVDPLLNDPQVLE